jgi:acetyl-CoA C-acetyltransferase
MESIKGKTAIVGIGEVPTGLFPERTAMEIAVKCCKMAIEDAGISKNEVDCIIPAGSLHSIEFHRSLTFSILVEELGLQYVAKLAPQVWTGGSSCSSAVKTAVSFICAGLAQTVLCVQADKLGTDQEKMGQQFQSFDSQWETPYGMLWNAIAGFTATRYLYETGTTEEQLASVPVSLRKWAALNPNAAFRDPLTIEDVLNSKMIVTPLHAFECNRLVDGGSAFIITSAERARRITDTLAYILGMGSRATQYFIEQTPSLMRYAYGEAAQYAYRMAGIGPKDIDIAEIYGSYPADHLIILERLGICAPGTAGQFVYEGHTSPGGKLPMATNGGILSQGHSGAGGGHALMVEAARQLMGKAGKRQVEKADIAAVTGSGGNSTDCHVTILGREVI